MKKNKKIFISSNEDRGIFVKISENKTCLSFWGDEEDAPREITFRDEDVLDLCNYIINEIKEARGKTPKEYVHDILSEMNDRNEK